MRYVNGKPMWIAQRETIGPDAGHWEVKDRFNGRALANNTGLLSASYVEVKDLTVKLNPECWQAPYIWMIYGPFGIGKTRSLLTFPPPILLFDLDHGTKSLTKTEIEKAQIEIVSDIDVEDFNDYTKFVGKLEAAV
jgi:hypothetical protein